MAGTHQIWGLDLKTNEITTFAGTRAEARLDGKLNVSAFGQPSGIVSDGKNLYVADSETNIIRTIIFKNNWSKRWSAAICSISATKTAKATNVQLQHPLGVEIYGDPLLIADTYNHKIKILNP